MLALPIIFFFSGTFASSVAGPVQAPGPDPNFTPIILELTEKGQGETLCQLYGKLENLVYKTEEGSFERLQEMATLELIEKSVKAIPGAEPCKTINLSTEDVKDSSLGAFEPPSNLPAKPQALSIIDEAEAEAVLADGGAGEEDQGSLCDNCEVDYEEPETKEFMENFKQDPDDQAAEAMENAKGKLTRVFVLSVLGSMTVVVGVTLGLFFAIRGCVRRARRKKGAKKRIKHTHSSHNTTRETDNATHH